jgi:hypothetical protein
VPVRRHDRVSKRTGKYPWIADVPDFANATGKRRRTPFDTRKRRRGLRGPLRRVLCSTQAATQEPRPPRTGKNQESVRARPAANPLVECSSVGRASGC